jgi:molybdenum cofactor guanylyltransferase
VISNAKVDHHEHEWAGLILIGGKSSRMHTDKSTLDYRGKPHREYLADLLLTFTPHVFYSGNPSSEIATYPGVCQVEDKFRDAGPLGGIVSAHLRYPSFALLVMACDMPFIDDPLIQELLIQRNPDKMATSFKHPVSRQIEPLFTFYELEGLRELRYYFEKGEKSPSKLLESMRVEWLIPQHPEKLTNANDPKAMEAAKTTLQQTRQ